MRAALLAAALAGGAAPAADPPPCRPDFAALLADAEFRHFPAGPAPRRLLTPDVRHGEAARFRTAIRRDGSGPPDFAGRYRVVRIGCGAGAVCPAFVDRGTGRVYFRPELFGAAALSIDADAPGGFETLNYRRDSRLLVVIGSPNEDGARTGVSYLEWRGGALRPVRFVPLARFCAGATR